MTKLFLLPLYLTAAAAGPPAFAQTGAPPKAASKSNPDISLNMLFLGSHEKPSGKTRFSIQEAELYFQSNIDPYWTGSLYLGAHYHEGHFDWDLEEAFIETLFIPQLTARLGKFYGRLGRHNELHTHHYPFIDPPLINERLLGGHGWSGYGLSASWLIPLPYFAEMTAQGFYQAEKAKGQGAGSGSLSLKNFWEIRDHSTLELALFYGTKINGLKNIRGASLTYKWKPLDTAKKRSLTWTAELLQGEAAKQSKAKQPAAAALAERNRRAILSRFAPLGHSGHGGGQSGRIPESQGGLSMAVEWRLLNSWRLQGRAEWLAPPRWNKINMQKYSALLGFARTEYSMFRLQYYGQKARGGGWTQGLALQSSVSMGPHPAHKY